jgi:integrase
MLATKEGRQAYVEPIVEDGGYRFTVRTGKPKDVATAKNAITNAAAGARIVCEAKGQKAISVKLTKRCIELLKAQVGKHKQYVFTLNGEPIASPKTALKSALKRAEITKKFTWHGYRHTWASWHIMNGTPLEVLQELGGWASIEMVQKYAHVAPGYAAQWSDNAKPVSLNKQNAA